MTKGSSVRGSLFRGYDGLVNDAFMKKAWAERERADLEEARRASDAKTLSARAEEAVAMHLLAIADLLGRARDEHEYLELLQRDERPHVSLRERWLLLHDE